MEAQLPDGQHFLLETHATECATLIMLLNGGLPGLAA